MGGYPDDLATLDLKEILEIPSVGKSIAEKIVEFLRSGHVRRRSTSCARRSRRASAR